MHLYVIRHSDPLWNGDGLTEQGYQEAQAVAERLKAIGITHLYTSNLFRASETARIASKMTGVKAETGEWLREPGYLSIRQQDKQEPVKNYTMWDTFGETVRNTMPPPAYADWTERAPFDDPRVEQAWNNFRRDADNMIADHGYRKEDGKYRIINPNDHRIALFTHNGTVLLFIAHLLLLPVSLVWSGFYSWPSAITDFLFEEHSEEWAVPRAVCVADVSHLAVNGLAMLFTPEPWTEGEVYPVFYRHGPALDQYVSSRLNKGVYPEDYLRANLAVLKRNVELAVRYGMTPGLWSVEPRSVPEELFRRYPMLRGARVDHPFRSFRPRYNLSTVHPVVQEHYAELMHNLLEAVPELGYMMIASNDSGAGFEHTRNMYAGRNGGAYLIREWKSDEQVAEAAGGNVIRFLEVLRDAAVEVRPGFRVILGVGCVAPERHIVWRGFGEGIDPSDSLEGLPKETRADLEKRDSMAHVSAPVTAAFNPLIGIPSPWLTYENLERLAEEGVDVLTSAGEVADPGMAPWCVNQEVWRAVHLARPVDVDEIVAKAARRWVGPDLSGRLVEAWRGADAAVRAYSPRLFLWADYGFVPYRLWVRPLIPDIEQIPKEGRAYYEEVMLSTPNNPTLVDLSRDILFDLNTPEEALGIVRRMDAAVWGPLDEAIRILSETAASISEEESPREVFVDQRDRLRALRCWLRTQRSTAAWIAGVPGYLEAQDEATRAERRQLLREMVGQEIENTRDLLELWETSSVHFMAVSTEGENTFMYGEDLGDLLRRRIGLMEGREDDEPYIDPDFMWRVPGMR